MSLLRINSSVGQILTIYILTNEWVLWKVIYIGLKVVLDSNNLSKPNLLHLSPHCLSYPIVWKQSQWIVNFKYKLHYIKGFEVSLIWDLNLLWKTKQTFRLDIRGKIQVIHKNNIFLIQNLSFFLKKTQHKQHLFTHFVDFILFLYFIQQNNK
jgi:hypothetical protein